MRYINTENLTIPSNWIDLAKNERFIPLWSYLKPIYESLVGKKCWYNESINDGTSNPIDHFRPKAKNVKKLEAKYADLEKIIWSQIFIGPQTGYPFLEFEPINYRYACGFANSSHTKESIDSITRGKSNFFPIRVNTSPSTTIRGLKSESIALLYPCDKKDPELITFNDLGQAIPSVKILTDTWDFCRVKISIEIYNMMYYKFSAKRKEIWLTCERNIEIIALLYNKTNKTNEEELSLDYFYSDYLKSLQKSSEFSAVAIDCTRYFINHKSGIIYKWLHDLPSGLLDK